MADTQARAAEGRTLVIGILGGIASGKSSVATALAGTDGLVLSADALAREALAEPQVLERVRARFGSRALGPDGLVDRAYLSTRVFDPEHGAELRRELESWIHPRVRDRIWARLEQARSSGVPRVVLDVPLLLENDAQHGLARACDVLVFVETSAEERERRARAERGWKAGEVLRREAAQLPLDEKKARADHVIQNDQGREELRGAVARLLNELR